jgi:hypothetical protein
VRHDTFRGAAIAGVFAASLIAFFFLPGALPASWLSADGPAA